jgi:hypothetical protein
LPRHQTQLSSVVLLRSQDAVDRLLTSCRVITNDECAANCMPTSQTWDGLLWPEGTSVRRVGLLSPLEAVFANAWRGVFCRKSWAAEAAPLLAAGPVLVAPVQRGST